MVSISTTITSALDTVMVSADSTAVFPCKPFLGIVYLTVRRSSDPHGEIATSTYARLANRSSQNCSDLPNTASDSCTMDAEYVLFHTSHSSGSGRDGSASGSGPVAASTPAANPPDISLSSTSPITADLVVIVDVSDSRPMAADFCCCKVVMFSNFWLCSSIANAFAASALATQVPP